MPRKASPGHNRFHQGQRIQTTGFLDSCGSVAAGTNHSVVESLAGISRSNLGGRQLGRHGEGRPDDRDELGNPTGRADIVADLVECSQAIAGIGDRGANHLGAQRSLGLRLRSSDGAEHVGRDQPRQHS